MWNECGLLVLSLMITSSAQADPFDAVETEWAGTENKLREDWTGSERNQAKLWTSYQESEGVLTQVDFENQNVVIEVSASDSKAEALAKAAEVIQQLTGPDSVIKRDELKIVPEVVERIEPAPFKGKTAYRIVIPFAANFIQKRAHKIYPLVKRWSEQNAISPFLVLAVIRQESGFNPRARSWVPAYGLMQIVPRFAGIEVMIALGRGAIGPNADALYDPNQNIEIGTTYLRLIHSVHFKDLQNTAQQHVISICAYNWGPDRLKKLLVRHPEMLKSDFQTFYADLLPRLPAETRDYVQKVLAYEHEFSKMEGL